MLILSMGCREGRVLEEKRKKENEYFGGRGGGRQMWGGGEGRKNRWAEIRAYFRRQMVIRLRIGMGENRLVRKTEMNPLQIRKENVSRILPK